MIEIGKSPAELNGQHTLFPAHNFGSYLGFLAPHPNCCNGERKYQLTTPPVSKKNQEMDKQILTFTQT